MPRKSFPKQSALAQTAEEYANNSTVHGLGYTFDRSLFKVDHALWVLVCLTFAVLAVHLTYQSYDNWQQDQVVITLKNTAKPVNEIPFPAVTICSTGLHMDIVEKILGENFLNWRNDSTGNITEDMAEYMADIFQIPNKTINILDILDTMVDSNVEASVAANSVRENVAACAENTAEQTKTKRKKRAASSENICCPRMVISSATISGSSSFASQTLGIYSKQPELNDLGKL